MCFKMTTSLFSIQLKNLQLENTVLIKQLMLFYQSLRLCVASKNFKTIVSYQSYECSSYPSPSMEKWTLPYSCFTLSSWTMY